MKLLGMYKNGNTINKIFSNGTRICETKDDEFKFDFARNMDIKITNSCSMRCPFCHEGSTQNGKHGNILNEKFIETLHPYQEVAIGGGNVLEHPDLIPFLEKLRDLKVITNITLNQLHFEQNIDLVDKMINEKLIYGLGVSLVNPTQEFIKKVKKYPKIVIHVLNGVLKPSDVQAMENNNLKMLILGYKHLRRGNEYFESDRKEIEKNQTWLYENLQEILNKFKVVSFDNLAIEQLNVKRLLSDSEWNEFYQGDDGTSTYYIDMVERKFARSSTASFDKRYDLLDSVDEMFKKIISEVGE